MVVTTAPGYDHMDDDVSNAALVEPAVVTTSFSDFHFDQYSIMVKYRTKSLHKASSHL